ncbi:hypothetical protein FLAVO9AF_160062 [Flavobacterium sp. 9AF]|uniref:hypothetical protein n=1 Tax=Flavobacterium sp. 9AF TaxID=2653142 RepID=UPI0012F144B0|nr:hypothetical protein [Flavobacterium sp. 9AF]VXB40807.1 hypothetical protein FLAVO9AF_160062 [Flavobacterium sp. 9AF]
MHFSKIENIVIGNQFLGIEVFSNENTEKVDVILVQKKKEELNVKDYYSFSSLETIALNKLASIPVILTVNTEKVLMKEIDIVEKNDLILVKKAFTNLNLDDFYYDIWRFESKSFVFIVRKNYLDDLVHRLTNACHLKIVSVYIGISTFKNIIHYVSQDTINFNGKTYVKSTQNVTNTDLLPQKVYDIGSIKIKGENILCFSGIVSFVTFNYGIGINNLI